MLRAAAVAACVLVATPSFGAPTAAIGHAIQAFKVGRYAKHARLSALTLKDLSEARRYGSKADIVGGIVDLSLVENRLDAVEALQLSGRYKKAQDGDILLLTCLRNTACHPEQFLNIAQTSNLHAEIIRRNPGLNGGQVDLKVGAVTERLMNRFFEGSGWSRLNGQVGATGIDGLYVKRQDGVIREVLVAESKYNTSLLSKTDFGRQMSEDWIRRKLVELQAAFPGESSYRDIDRFIEKGSYRAVVWNLRVDDDAIHVALSKVKSKGGHVDLTRAAGTDVEVLAAPLRKRIEFKEPSNTFQESFLGWYRDELNSIGSAEF